MSAATTLDEFLADQEKALEAKKAELREVEALGPIPGLSPWLVHGTLYGYRHVAHKLIDLGAFLVWARANTTPVHAIKGRYASMQPRIPDTRDYEGAVIVATGDLVVGYCSIQRTFKVEVWLERGYKISFDSSAHPQGADLCPIAVMDPHAHREPRVLYWKKPQNTTATAQFLYGSVDKQSCDLVSLMTFDAFEGAFATQGGGA